MMMVRVSCCHMKHIVFLPNPVPWVKSLKLEIEFDEKQEEFLRARLPLAIVHFLKTFTDTLKPTKELALVESVEKSLNSDAV